MTTDLVKLVQSECTPFCMYLFVEIHTFRGLKYVPLFVFVLLPLELLEKEAYSGLGPVLSRCSNYKYFLGWIN